MSMKSVNIAAGKAIVNIPGWAQDFNDGTLKTGVIKRSETSYNYVPLIYRATKLRCDSLASVPVAIMRGEAEAEWPFPETDLWDLIWKTEASLLLTGGAYWLKNANTYGYVKEIQWMNPTMMDVQYDNKAGKKVFRQTGEGGQEWKEDDIVYFREFTLNDDIAPGIGPGNVALNDAQLLNYLSLFAGQFFKGGAMPVTVMSFDGMTDPQEAKRVEGWFRQRITGIRNAFRVLAVGKKTEMHNLTPPMKDLALPELKDQAREAVADAFGIPQTMLSDAANYATASEHRMSFWSDTIRPRAPFYTSVINRQLLDKMKLKIKFNFEVMDIFQKDVNEAAAAVSNLVNSGMPLGLACEVLGVELPDDWDYDKLTAVVEEQKEQAREQFAENLDKKEDKDDEKTDLAKWQKKALKRLAKGEPALCEFESDYISSVRNAEIFDALADANAEDDVRVIFGSNGKPSIDLTTELKRANDLLEKAGND